jgi:hypothetical protein
MNLKRLIVASVALAALSPGVWADDVTDTYLTNAGFDDSSSFATADVDNDHTPKSWDVKGWTITSSAANGYSAAYGFGSTCKVNTTAVPSSDENGSSDGGVLGISVGWGPSTVTYGQTVALSPGTYTMKYNVYNAGTVTAIGANKFGIVPDGGTAVYGTSTSFEIGKWKTESVTLSLTKTTFCTITVGFQAINEEGSGSNAKLFVDKVTLEKTVSWDDAKSAAESLLTTYSTSTCDEKTALENKLNTSDPTFKDTEELYQLLEKFEDAAKYSTEIEDANKAKAVKEAYSYSYKELVPTDVTKWNTNSFIKKTLNEHWNGKSGQNYYESNNWNGSWSYAASHTVNLPKGKYAFMITSRSSDTNVTSEISVKVGTNDAETETLPAVGGTGRGVTLDGTPGFAYDQRYANGGNGYGWRYSYIEFEVTSEKESVTIALTSASTSSERWFGAVEPVIIGDVEPNTVAVLQTEGVALKEKLDEANKILENSVASESNVETYKKVVESAQKIYDEATDIADLVAPVSDLESARQAYVIKANPINNLTFDYSFIIPEVNATNWKRSITGGNYQLNTNSSKNGEYSGQFLESWNGSVTVASVYAELTDIPNGKYSFTAAIFGYDQNSGSPGVKELKLFFNEGLTTVSNPEVMNYVTVEGEVTNNTAKFGINNELNNWFGIGVNSCSLVFSGRNDVDLTEFNKLCSTANELLKQNMDATVKSTLKSASAVELTESSSEAEVAKAVLSEASVAIYSPIETTITTEKAKVSEYCSKDVVSSFETAISDIQKSLDEGKISGDGTTEIKAIKSARLTTILAQTTENAVMTNALENPSFESGKDASWQYVTTLSGYVDCSVKEPQNAPHGSKVLNMWSQNVTKIEVWQKVVLPAGKYKLTVDARTDSEPISSTDTQLRTYMNYKNTSYSEGLKAVEGTWNADSSPWTTLSTIFNIVASTEVEMGMYSKGSGTGTNGWYQIDNFQLIRLGDPDTKYTRTVSNKFGSLCLPHASSETSGIAKLYKITEVTSATVTVEEQEEIKLDAGYPYLFQKKSDATEISVTYTGNPVPDAVNTDTYLVGSLSEFTVPAGNYVLQNDEFRVVNSEDFKVAANRAYLKGTSSSSAALRISFDNEGATGIRAVEALTGGKATIYDLNGRKLDGLRKGINIVDGVKVFVK